MATRKAKQATRGRATGMTTDEVLAYALSKPGAWLDHPWDEDHNAIKVHTKIFAMTGAVQTEPAFTVRHEDLESTEVWRQRLPEAVRPARYLVNKPWSTVYVEEPIDADDLRELVDESYLAVVARLPKKHRPEGWDAGVAD